MERQCPVCGETVSDDSVEFCPICGTKLPPAEPAEDVEPWEIGDLEDEESPAEESNDEEGETGTEEEKGDEEQPDIVVVEGESPESVNDEVERKAEEKSDTGEKKEPKKKKKGKRPKEKKRGEKVKKKKKRGENTKKSNSREERRRKIKESMKEKGEKRTIFDYYVLNTAALVFFTILAVFVAIEFILIIFNITASAPEVLFSFAPILGSTVGFRGAPVLLLVAVLSGSDALFHYYDKKRNLYISLIFTIIMLAGALIALITATSSSEMLTVSMGFGILALILLLDLISISRYPKILEDPGRANFEEYLLKEDEIEALIQEEEEKLSLKEQQIEELQQNIDMMGEQLAEEEEKLRMKDEELAKIQSEIQMKEQELLSEEEEIRMKEQELSTVIESELKQRMEEQMMEEEEKLRMKEEELVRAKNELDIQRKLHEEAREKLRMKEQELNTLRSELEKQVREKLEEEEKLRMKEAATRMKEQEKQKRVLYPFTAMVGQEDMKKALILNAIYPEIGGVLIRGQKGTGKSVSVRGLAEVLPDIRTTGCRFNCDPDDVENLCPECRAKYEKGILDVFERPVKVVDLPLNITEDRLLGSIDIEKILKEGVRSFEPGLLAEAHRGILYVDEINLLDDYIVDLLLDAASSGRAVIEREGISFTHPARFIIVGSMNPEEGELRPQLLDRLALEVEVSGIKDVEERMEIVRRRKEFTENPELFREKYSGQQEELRNRITEAREKLSSISVSPDILDLIGKLCVEFDVDGHRADIIIERAARANAAFEGRTEVNIEDVVTAATYALPHRARNVQGAFTGELVKKTVERLGRGGS